jgi:hypothetical protein
VCRVGTFYYYYLTYVSSLESLFYVMMSEQL